MSTLVDWMILDLVEEHDLIGNFSEKQLGPCRYNMRAGRAFEPNTGNEMVLGQVGAGSRPQTWTIKPSGTLVVMTRESLKLPSNVYATYGQLNSWARRGLYLMNVSIVEPLYSGYLACYLVNFSKNDVNIAPDDSVAKVCFHVLASDPKTDNPFVIGQQPYVRELAKDAQTYPVSFMDIGGVEERAVTKAEVAIKRLLTWGGVGIAFFLAWASLEPVIHKYVWEWWGVASESTKSEYQALQHEAENAKESSEKASKEAEAIAKQLELAKEVEALKKSVEELNKSAKLDSSKPSN